ncbi:hypothetical protein [Neobacillus drentensis]|uniref:hypothetical protein n=1 Tax=Neobacillus drentensis TaxID=220684 RepID=UPI003000BD82
MIIFLDNCTTIWFKLVRDPSDHPRVNQAEIDYIKDGGGFADIGEKKTKVKWAHIRLLLTNRQMIEFILVSTP